MTLQDYSSIASIVQSLSVTGLLVIIAWAFYTGNVVSRPVLDKILERYTEQFRAMFEQIIEMLKDGGNGKRGGW